MTCVWLSCSSLLVAAIAPGQSTGQAELTGQGLAPTTTRPVFAFAGGALGPTTQPSGPIVRLEDVFDSVERYYPLLAAALLQRDVAEGDLLSAQGAFDLNLRSGVSTVARGDIRNTRADTLLEQPTPFWGTTFFGGYRLGIGDFRTHERGASTYEGGEFRGGVRVPILRDGPLDLRRARLEQASIDRTAAEPFIETQRLDFYRIAARVYWTAVAAAQRLAIAQDLLDIAERRNVGIRERVRRGDLAEIEQLNNEGLVADRRARLIFAVRQHEAAAVELSLFYRDAAGRPVLLDVSRLPRDFPKADAYTPEQLAADVHTALSNRPELIRLRLARERQEVELRLARTQLLPGLDFQALGSQDIGPPDISSDKSTMEWELGLVLQVPVQQRVARGRVRSLRGQISQIRAQEQFLAERVTAEVQNAASAVGRNYEQYEQFRVAAELARQVALGEFRRFELGQSNILQVNVQELAANDAALREVDAIAEYHRSLADYRAALATIAQR